MNRIGRPSHRGRRGLGRVAAVAALLAAVAPAGAQAAELSASPATLASVLTSAQGGDTINLSSGSYGTFRGASKPALVTIKPAPAASVTMAINFAPATNIRLEGVTLQEAIVGSTSRNVTIANSTFTGQAVIRTAQFDNSNVVFDGNTHANVSVCSACYEGRITLPGDGPHPSGVTIRNSTFGPGGNADGIQNGSNGTVIENNEFLGIEQGDPSLAHSDPIQLYGSSNTVVRGNYIHDNASGIMSPDGADHELIEDNVIVRTENSPIIIGPDRGSIIRHNTLPAGSLRICDASGPGTCNDPRRSSTGTIVTDNILGQLWINGAPQLAAEGHNLIGSVAPSTFALATGDLRGTPIYVGGANPTTKAGYALDSRSIGRADASDGSDRGARFTTSSPAPTPDPSSPTPIPPAPPAPVPVPAPAPSTPAPAATPWPGTAQSPGLERSPQLPAPHVDQQDTAAPRAEVRLLSSIQKVIRTGTLRIAIASDEPTTIVLDARLRAGRRPGEGAPRMRLITPAPIRLWVAQDGSRTVSLRLSPSQRRDLVTSAGARIVIRTVATDRSRNRREARATFTLAR